MATPSERTVMRRQQKAGVPQRYQGLTMSQLEDQSRAHLNGEVGAAYTEILGRARAWLEGSDWALVLSGPSGSSKTSIASALVGLEQQRAGFLCAAAFVDSMRDGKPISWFMDRAELFVLDDLGGEYATYYSNTAVDRFVAECYWLGKRLVLTTNMSKENLSDFYSARLVDRLSEDSLWLPSVYYSFRRRMMVDG